MDRRSLLYVPKASIPPAGNVDLPQGVKLIDDGHAVWWTLRPLGKSLMMTHLLISPYDKDMINLIPDGCQAIGETAASVGGNDGEARYSAHSKLHRSTESAAGPPLVSTTCSS